jgi:hypothetical protein
MREDLIRHPIPAPLAPDELARQGSRGVEAALVATLALAALLVRRPWQPQGPFWIDEAWVADSLRVPLDQLRGLAGSTPLGWLALLRLVPPVGGLERYRVVPLLFALAAIVPAHLLGRRVALTGATRWAACLPAVTAGLAVGLLPAAVARPFLKQFTCEILVALVLVLLLARAEAAFTPARLALLGAACVPAALLSNTSLFVSAAAVAALGIRVLLRAEWRRLPGLLGLAAGVACVDLVALAWLLPARGDPTLIRYWAQIGTFLPVHRGLHVAATVAGHRLAVALGDVGFGPWPVVVVLAVTGAVVLWRAGFPAVALSLPLLGAELVAASATRRFPFMEERTSLFALALVAVFCGTGVGAIAARLLGSRRTASLGVLGLVGGLALLAPAAADAGAARVPRELVPEQLSLLQSQLRPGDVVLVSAFASWQYAYYAPDRPTFRTIPPRWAAVPFTVAYPGRRDLVVVGGLDDAAIRGALLDAAGLTKRIWLVLGHSEPGRDEEKLWDAAARSIGRVTKVRTGVVERFGPRRAELQRPWLIEVGRRTGPPTVGSFD